MVYLCFDQPDIHLNLMLAEIWKSSFFSTRQSFASPHFQHILSSLQDIASCILYVWPAIHKGANLLRQAHLDTPDCFVRLPNRAIQTDLRQRPTKN
jgi:hypothetical protein